MFDRIKRMSSTQNVYKDTQQVTMPWNYNKRNNL